jgi:hypothetical protein
MKFLPVTVSVKSGPPAMADAGASPLTIGAEAVMVTVAELESSPLALSTVTAKAPGSASRDAGTDAVICAGPANVVASGDPFHRTVLFQANSEPVTVRVRESVPAAAEVGLTVATVGRAGSMVKLSVLLDAPPPGFEAVMPADPAAASRLAGTNAVSCPELTNVVATGEPFHCTAAPVRKFAPTIVRLTAVPALADEGLSVRSKGGSPMLNGRTPDDAFAVTTHTAAVPGFATIAAATIAMSCVALKNVVASAVPLHWIVEFEAKFVPVTVSVNVDAPAVIVLGLIAVTTGAGGSRRKSIAAERPPLGTSRT